MTIKPGRRMISKLEKAELKEITSAEAYGATCAGASVGASVDAAVVPSALTDEA
jgi:hypothetical protein